MSVNPNLETLMNLVDELQDQMPEGKYLEAMNALRDLHAGRVPPPPRPALRPIPHARFVVPEGCVELTQEENRIYQRVYERTFRSDALPSILQALRSHALWRCVCREWNKEQNPPLEPHSILESYPAVSRTMRHNPSTEQWWVDRTVEQKIAIIHEALREGYEQMKTAYEEEKNPEPEVCPFISRHSVGKWEDPARNPRSKWNCVCGSVNLLAKNWRQHEISEKHMKWVADGRKITDTIKRKMLDCTCHVRNRDTKTESTYFTPATVWTKHKKDKNWNPDLKVCQGKRITPSCAGSILGYNISWVQPCDTYRPQSLNEWICSELKGKAWEYKVTNPRVITKVGEPTIEREREMNLAPQPVPPTLPELPHRSGGVWCEVRRTQVCWMTEENYARFISVQWLPIEVD